MNRIIARALALLIVFNASSKLLADWSADTAIKGETSRMAPAIAFFDKNLQLIHPSDSGDYLYWASYSKGVWGTNVRFAEVRSKGAPPTVVAGYNEMVVFYRGESSNGYLWTIKYKGGKWIENQQMKDDAGKWISDTRGVGVTLDQNDNFNVVYRKHTGNDDPDDTLWYTKGRPGGVWDAPVQIANFQAQSAPALAMVDATMHMIFAGTNDVIYDCSRKPGGDWTLAPIPNAHGHDVGVTSHGGKLYVAFVGKGKERLYFTKLGVGGWTDPVEIKGHDATHAPALAGNSATGKLYLVHVGRGGSQLYYSENKDP